TVPLAGSAIKLWMPKLPAFTLPLMVIWSGGELVAVIVMLPFKRFTDAVPIKGFIEPSAALSSAKVRAFAGGPPAWNVMVCGGLAPMVMTSVWPVPAAPCVSRLVGWVVPFESPSTVSRAGVEAPPMVRVEVALVLVSTRWLVGLSDA